MLEEAKRTTETMALVRKDFRLSLLTAIQLPSWGLFLVLFPYIFPFYKFPLPPVVVQGNPLHPAPGCLGAFAAAGRVLPCSSAQFGHGECWQCLCGKLRSLDAVLLIFNFF